MSKLYHRLFRAGVWIKAIDGILETVGGVLVLTVKESTMIGLILLVTQQELMEDPHDVVATLARHAITHVTESSKLFGGIYLMAHGAVNLFLAVGLLRNRLWSYSVAIAILCIFMTYQIYRITLHHSLLLMLATGIDAVIILLIRHEYLSVKRAA